MKYEPNDSTRAEVVRLAGKGTPGAQIAAKLGIARATLYEHHKPELDKGHAKAHAAVISTLYEKAIGGDTACLIFWCKTRLRWREVRADDDTAEEKALLRQMRALGCDPKDLMRWLSREAERLNPMEGVAAALHKETEQPRRTH
jgi:hypothetical protein